MSTSISIRAVASTESKEFQKHFKAVQFCIENDLSFPKETTEFFKGKVGGDDLDVIRRDCIINYIKDGVEVKLKIISDNSWEKRIKVSDIPKEVDEIIITLS
jgi:hypothetical protein